MGIVGRLLVLLALLAMPLGMAPASAVDHHVTLAGRAMKHCPDQSSKPEHHDGLAPCSMACASALPAQELVRDELAIGHAEIVVPTKGYALRGILPEIATPPPKLA